MAAERLTQSQIDEALERLDGALLRGGHRAQIYRVGGTVMCVVQDARDSTRNVGAWFTQPTPVRVAAADVGRDMGLPEDWLNEAAMALVPAGAGFDAWRFFPFPDVQPGIPADRAVIFGSHARGNAGPESDIDVLVISPQFDRDRFAAEPLLWRLTRKVDPRIEPVPVGESEYSGQARSPLVDEAKRDGFVVEAA